MNNLPRSPRIFIKNWTAACYSAADSILQLIRVPAAGYELRLILSHDWLEFRRLDTSCGWLEFWQLDTSCGWFHHTADSSSSGWIGVVAMKRQESQKWVVWHKSYSRLANSSKTHWYKNTLLHWKSCGSYWVYSDTFSKAGPHEDRSTYGNDSIARWLSRNIYCAASRILRHIFVFMVMLLIKEQQIPWRPFLKAKSKILIPLHPIDALAYILVITASLLKKQQRSQWSRWPFLKLNCGIMATLFKKHWMYYNNPFKKQQRQNIIIIIMQKKIQLLGWPFLKVTGGIVATLHKTGAGKTSFLQ